MLLLALEALFLIPEEVPFRLAVVRRAWIGVSESTSVDAVRFGLGDAEVDGVEVHEEALDVEEEEVPVEVLDDVPEDFAEEEEEEEEDDDEVEVEDAEDTSAAPSTFQIPCIVGATL